MAAKHDLAVADFKRVASWGFGDAAFHRHWDAISSFNKLRRIGFGDWMDSEEMFLRLFREMRERRIIPA